MLVSLDSTNNANLPDNRHYICEMSVCVAGREVGLCRLISRYSNPIPVGSVDLSMYNNLTAELFVFQQGMLLPRVLILKPIDDVMSVSNHSHRVYVRMEDDDVFTPQRTLLSINSHKQQLWCVA